MSVTGADKPARGVSARTLATREKLYAAATKLIGERAVEQVSVDEIAAAAGVAKGTVYYNFHSKDALIAALIDDRVSLLVASMKDAARADDPHLAVRAMTESVLSFIEANTAFAQLLATELWRSRSTWHDQLAAMREELLAIAEALIERTPTLRRLHPDLPARVAAAGMWSTTFVIALDWRVYTPERPRAEVLETVMLILGASD
ncbi:TetR family transcriptional regulator [Antricoccus suffuscus]|uniref:TetR family transcriptional regulator n=1 Tax=Antricoccus suffuscus TaxID=1629062 RepID=A0A2T1A026_9ACTN|nr:TetR/AcrR family transcriptional regulator [Antricoccus suffuscus]PRZ41955.1 TetR family transcriptional regulator [Antricoccus suffuscus]